MPLSPENIHATVAEYQRQQALLEQQAVELEAQAAELEMQVTELAEANAALKAAEAATAEAHRRALNEMAERVRQATLFDAALRTVPVAVAILDRDLRYIRVNEACAAMTGLPKDAHVGRTLLEVNPRISPDIDRAIREVRDTGAPRYNLRLTRPTPHAKGGAIEIVMHINAFYDANGAIAGVCSTAMDITEWKGLQDQLNKAQRLDAVGQVTAGIAHDFNNLLTVVSSLTDLMMLEMPAHAPHRADVEEIRAAANRATTLARRMLAMAHRKSVAPRPVEIRAVIEDAREILTRVAGPGVRVELRADNSRGVVGADPTHLEQVIMNLVINAAHATSEGGTIVVSTRDVILDQPVVTRSGELRAGAYAELAVTDSGSGMNDETLSRIFEPFFTTKPAGKGTGLGLATVFAIVRDLGGGIEVTSAPGAGTTFRVLFPRLEDQEPTGPRQQRALAAAALPRGTETILLVEDDDIVRAGIARLLGRQGYNVLQAGHGGEALRLLTQESDIKLVVSDLNMPGVGGREMTSRMRALGHTLPVLFLSGSSGPEHEPGAAPPLDPRDRYIAKPFKIESLLTTVREMINAA